MKTLARFSNFYVNPVWPSIFEHIQEPGGEGAHCAPLNMLGSGGVRVPISFGFTIFKRIQEVWMPRTLQNKIWLLPPLGQIGLRPAERVLFSKFDFNCRLHNDQFTHNQNDCFTTQDDVHTSSTGQEFDADRKDSLWYIFFDIAEYNWYFVGERGMQGAARAVSYSVQTLNFDSLSILPFKSKNWVATQSFAIENTTKIDHNLFQSQMFWFSCLSDNCNTMDPTSESSTTNSNSGLDS